MKLIEYMETNRYSCQQFADLLKDHEYKATKRAVQSWRLGQRPKFLAMVAIEKATNGEVKPASFL